MGAPDRGVLHQSCNAGRKFAPSQYWYMEESSGDLQKLTDTHTCRVAPALNIDR